ncbi:unnamed protein product, partial [Phaeothamnion confervicola]
SPFIGPFVLSTHAIHLSGRFMKRANRSREAFDYLFLKFQTVILRRVRGSSAPKPTNLNQRKMKPAPFTEVVKSELLFAAERLKEQAEEAVAALSWRTATSVDRIGDALLELEVAIFRARPDVLLVLLVLLLTAIFLMLLALKRLINAPQRIAQVPQAALDARRSAAAAAAAVMPPPVTENNEETAPEAESLNEIYEDAAATDAEMPFSPDNAANRLYLRGRASQSAATALSVGPFAPPAAVAAAATAA